ncbi:hypothetical protein SFC02_13370 [Terribacillus goriensis]|uniref:hypothetical protein n=1 Tax=Terribacillus saccharophilus TaxID=361277 RepID=UPI00398307FE
MAFTNSAANTLADIAFLVYDQVGGEQDNYEVIPLNPIYIADRYALIYDDKQSIAKKAACSPEHAAFY